MAQHTGHHPTIRNPCKVVRHRPLSPWLKAALHVKFPHGKLVLASYVPGAWNAAVPFAFSTVDTSEASRNLL